MTSCSNLCQRSIHSPHHVLKTFRPFLVKVTGAAQSDFGLGQLQVDKKFPLNWQGHKLHQDSLTKEEWILDLSPGNAGPSSKASLWKYYSILGSAFTSMSMWQYVDESQGSKNWDRPRATGYQPTEFKGSLLKRCWCLGLGQNALSCPNPNPQNAIGVRRQHLGGSERTGHHKSVNPFEVASFAERLVEIVVAKPPAWSQWSFLFFVNLAALTGSVLVCTGIGSAR